MKTISIRRSLAGLLAALVVVGIGCTAPGGGASAPASLGAPEFEAPASAAAPSDSVGPTSGGKYGDDGYGASDEYATPVP
ncbi:MAG: hypothetical protein ABIQ58_08860 [Candidatus Limnocylindrales bacterium]